MFQSTPAPSGSHAWRVLVVAATLALLFDAGAASATILTQRYQFQPPTVQLEDGFHRVEMPGTWGYGNPGQPVLPMAPARILLPPGETITSIEIVPGERVTLPGAYLVAAGQRQYPLSDAGPHAVDPPDAAIYGSPEPFPGRLHDQPHVGLFRGYRIAQFALHPVEYVPAEGRLEWLTSVEVRITTAPDAGALAETARMIRHDQGTVERVGHLVDNADQAFAYRGVQRLRGDDQLDPEAGYKYVIITTDMWDDYLDPLVEFETERGFKAGVFLKSWILDNYTAGVDEQDNIRDFVIDAYQTWGTDYLLLVGDARDANGIPHRGLYSTTAYSTSDDDIAADMYYSCLDGTWNDDGDGLWGEPGEDDLYHELGVARACVDNATEMENFLTKVTRYVLEPIIEECDEALMAGELLWSDPTWGGDYKDEIKDGSSAHGYTTVGFPPTMNVDVLYDRNATWSYTQLIALMENGLNIVNHLGHCDVTYAMKMYNSNIPSFDNDGTVHTYNFVYSQGCYCGSFDNRGSGGSYGEDCFAETFQTDDDGAVAVVMNARYGWGQHMSTNGSSQYFDREFFDAMFGEGIFAIADVNDDSKMDTIWAINYGANRYCYYELNVFGDPTMHLWTAEPGDLEVVHASSVLIGQPEMDVFVNAAGGGPVENARVTIYTDDYSVWDSALTDVTGRAVLHPEAETPATLYVKATAHDYLDADSQCAIIPPDGPYLIFQGCAVLDAGGDGDGVLDAGESVGLEMTIENVGIEPTTGVVATIASTDPHVTITEPVRSFPGIPAGAQGLCVEPFEFDVSGATPDEHVIAFTVTMQANEGSWDGHFNLPVESPVLEAGDLVVDDFAPPGNGDGGADPGDVFFVALDIANVGHSDCGELTATLTCSHPEAMVLDGLGECGGVPMGGEATASGFQMELTAACPTPFMLPIEVELSGAAGFTATLAYEIPVGPWFDDAEAERGWTLGAPGDDAGSGHWVREDPVEAVSSGGQVAQPEDDHTPDPGVICFVTGNADPGAPSGSNDVDGGKTTLLSPVFDLADAVSATLSYWRWYTNDLGNNPGEDWWTVDVTDDGVGWTHLEYTQASANSWNEYTFNIADFVSFTDHFQVRFIAEDLSPGSLVEAAVDDFALDVVRAPTAGISPAEVDAIRQANGFVSVSPNPFNPATTIVYEVGQSTSVRLRVYDVSGRMVRSLIDDTVEAGEHTVTFDGRGASGRALASGIYFLRLDTPEVMEVRQITLLK
jgi:hypothetical protein